jgi:hypothetical protein
MHVHTLSYLSTEQSMFTVISQFKYVGIKKLKYTSTNYFLIFYMALYYLYGASYKWIYDSTEIVIFKDRFPFVIN